MVIQTQTVISNPDTFYIIGAFFVVDGFFLNWDTWGACSATCDAGSRSRSRVYAPPEYGGQDIEGEIEQSEECNDGPCPGQTHQF